MKRNTHLGVSLVDLVLLAAPFVVLAVVWNRLPERIPTHWNWQGQIDGWSPKAFGLLMFPVTNLLVYTLVTLLPLIDSRMKRDPDLTAGNLSALRITRLSITALFAFLFAVQVGAALDGGLASGVLIMNGLLLAFFVMGNFFGNLKPNRFVGVRTPWTLKCPETWRATHRRCGQLMVFGSLALLALQFFVRNITPYAVTALAALAVWSMGYSWMYYRQHGRGQGAT